MYYFFFRVEVTTDEAVSGAPEAVSFQQLRDFDLKVQRDARSGSRKLRFEKHSHDEKSDSGRLLKVKGQSEVPAGNSCGKIRLNP